MSVSKQGLWNLLEIKKKSIDLIQSMASKN